MVLLFAMRACFATDDMTACISKCKLNAKKDGVKARPFLLYLY